MRPFAPFLVLVATAAFVSGCETIRFQAPRATPDFVARPRSHHTFGVATVVASTNEICAQPFTTCVVGAQTQLEDGVAQVLASVAQPATPGERPEGVATVRGLGLSLIVSRGAPTIMDFEWSFVLTDRTGNVAVRLHDIASAPLGGDGEQSFLRIENSILERIRTATLSSSLGPNA